MRFPKVPKISNILGPSWKTSLGGLAVFAGYIVKAAANPMIGDILIAGGTALGLMNARDKDKSSEEHGL